jgi:rhamnosyl/mannosyltransferase
LLLFVGRLVAYKGLSYLLEAMTDLPAVRLAIIGDGPEKPALSQFIRAKQLQERIHFFPNITDDQLPAYYHACDAFVLPSSQVNETFGLVQLEAMTAGKPVISTRLPTGVPYVNEDGKSGLVVEPRSSAALKNAIQRLLADPVMAQEFGQYGSERAQQLFDIRRSAELVAECYRELTS